MIRTNAHGVTTALRFSIVGLTASLMLGGCSSSEADPSAEAAPSSSESSTPPGSTATNAGAGEAASAAPTPSPTTAGYKPATAQGPAENVPLPVMPELAKEESKEGLEAYARYWYELVNYVLETGETSPISDISIPPCEVCSNVYDVVSDGYYEDDWIVGGSITPVGAHSNYILTSTGKYQVLIQIKQEKTEYRGSGNTLYGVDEGFDADTVQMMEATYSNGQWHPHNVVTIKR